MKSIVARAALGACILTLPASFGLRAEDAVKGYDDAASTLKELIEKAELNIRKVDGLIEERKVTERNIVRDEKARAAIQRGNELYAAGDLEEAKKAWNEALAITKNEEMKRYLAEEERRAERKAAEERAARDLRMKQLDADGIALFGEGRLEEAEGKFRELLSLDADNRSAGEYLENRIPALRRERQQKAEREKNARAAFERGNEYKASGNMKAARDAWKETLSLTSDTALQAMAAGGIRDADGQLAALRVKIQGLQAEGVILFEKDSLEEAEDRFREVLSLEGTNLQAMNYFEVKIPARKTELARLAMQEEKSKAALLSGSKFYDAAQKERAMAVWQTGLQLAQQESTRAAITARIRKAEDQAAADNVARMARMEQIKMNGAALFSKDALDESEALFGELLALNAGDPDAQQYITTLIPDRRNELARLAAVEHQAETVAGGAEKLFLAGDYSGAIVGWQQAISLSGIPETKAACARRIQTAEEKLRQQEIARRAHTEQLAIEGVALFNQHSIDKAEAKFREVLLLDGENQIARQYIDTRIPARKGELARLAEIEGKAMTALEQGSKLYDSGDYLGAKTLWQEALGTAQQPATKAAITERIAKADGEQAALEAAITALQSEAFSLFTADSLGASEAKFLKLLTLDGENQNAKHYLETAIPARKGELARLAAQEDKAKAGLASGNKLYTAGQKSEAMAAWQSALPLALKEATRTAISTRIREAEAEAAAEQAAKLARIEQLQNDGVTLFRQDSINESEAKFKELVILDAQNKTATYYLGNRIPGRKAELARIAAAEEKAKATFEGGNKLYAAGDYAGAKSAWQEALSVAVEPATKTTITQRISSADAEQVAIQSKVDALQSEAAALFNADNLTASEAKFREVLALKPTNLQAMDYYEVQIPARKAELERRAAVELKAETAAEGAEKLFLAGDYTGAIVGWQQAVNQTETPESRIAYMGRMDDAREKQREKEAALQGRIEQLQSEGIALFQADSLEASVAKFHELQAIDAQNQNAKHYLETAIPARKGELARLAAQEDKAKAGLASGNKLYTAGQKSEAMAAWQSALPLALKEATRTAISTRIREAEAEAAAEQAAKLARIEQLQNDGVTLFRQDSINESEAKFKELVILDSQNKTATYYLGNRIPGRKAELARIAAAEEKAKATFEGGNKLYAAGDYAGAKSAWQEALSVAVEPATKTTITQRISSADAEQVAIQSKVDALQSEAAALFNADNLTASEAKFREVLALKPTNLQAMDYYEVQIPARKAELERRAAVELKAETAAEGAEKLFLAGDYTGALVGWQQAVNQTETPESRIAYMGRMDDAREKQREKEAALQGRIEQLQSEGIALFQADSLEASVAKFHELQAIDAQNQNAKHYLETAIPARKGELARLAAQEDNAKAGLASGNKLYTAGQKSEAMAAWQSALPLALKEATRTAISTRIREAEAEAAAEQAAKLARIEQLQNDGVTLFRQDSINESEAKFKELVILDSQNKTATYYLGNRIPGRKAELARIAAAEEKAKATFEGGNKLYAAGDYAGAKSAWQEALSVAVEPATKTTITQRISSADAEQVAIQSKVDALQSEAAALFNADNLTASEAKFRELLLLQPTHMLAMEYFEVQIPARKAELERIAEAEGKAGTEFKRGNVLYAGGDYAAAKIVWQEALNTAVKPETKASITDWMNKAEAEQPALQSRIGFLQREGSTLFAEDRLEESAATFGELRSLKPSDPYANEYIEVKIPARKAALAKAAELEAEAKAAFVSGNSLYDAGNRAEAGEAWKKALGLAQSSETQDAVNARIARAAEQKQREAEALRIKVEGLCQEGSALFQADRLNEAAAKFNEVLVLDAAHQVAGQYLETSIPERKALLQRRREATKLAEVAMERGNQLYASGDYEGAKVAWMEALDITAKAKQ
uniref:Tetratricopeptide TPR_2 repeat protein n=1 Tax=Chlorobium phaeovibrioides (strain DSM 265 / 1930) TaxID=290318 RepID=A4SD89_CHLPM